MNSKDNIVTSKILRQKLDLLLRTGQLLIESSADTSRVRRNLERTAAYLGLPAENLHIEIDYYMLHVNLSDECHSFSKMQRCANHGINMEIIEQISKLTWRAISEDYSLERFGAELERIGRGKRHYSEWMVAICAGFACGGFCIQFGCDWTSFFYASIAAALGNRLRMYLNHLGSNVYANFAIAAFLSTILALFRCGFSLLSFRQRRGIRSWPARCSSCRVCHSSTR